jgi:hypothetical protein
MVDQLDLLERRKRILSGGVKLLYGRATGMVLAWTELCEDVSASLGTVCGTYHNGMQK